MRFDSLHSKWHGNRISERPRPSLTISTVPSADDREQLCAGLQQCGLFVIRFLNGRAIGAGPFLIADESRQMGMRIPSPRRASIIHSAPIVATLHRANKFDNGCLSRHALDFPRETRRRGNNRGFTEVRDSEGDLSVIVPRIGMGR
jgi:hypothetical protein